ncbi:hypothetical protein EVB97_167 [Rhizobium phage RHph_Y65]|uniref:Uncharacterized protein n=1 Tax=Rhizobium phage RHph_Y65 TaxID=2509785 RepID=A0A7S5R7W1_9CAUD|nr:hypothetical protein PQC17_gp167 [Rhizobium phage RHph_Y65]QIG72725.1 hypothetical protein EVB97_167 [Rhizobium phage RHph_Y65]
MSMKFQEGMHFKLEGATLKGKNRIRDNGSEWQVVSVKDGEVLFESVLTSYLKWHPLNEESDFTVVERMQDVEDMNDSIEIEGHFL